MARFWTVELMPQLTYAAVSLGRQVINGSILNISKLLTSLSLDEESPASSKTYLSLMFSLFDKSDDPTVKVEIGRIVAAILRCLCASEPLPNPSHRDSLLHRLYQLHPDVAQPLAMMVTQARWPIIRSEGWFALALMARSVEGSAAVDSILQQVEVFGGLEASIRGQSSLLTTNLSESYSDPGSPDLSEGRTTSERRADMQTKDRENAMVMVSEILRNRGQNMSEVRRSVFEDLLNGRE
ncbi:hypothetical protein MMC19_004825 [Ptychographa xylographoides]|nr:hypothetical protein [Ptychographa xylographoides]